MKIKYFIFGAICIFLSAVLTFLVILSADLYFHKKYLTRVGLNYRGYRGEVLGKKAPGEIRIVMLGGSQVFGYGIAYTSAIPYKLEHELQQSCGNLNGPKKITVVNLAYNSEGAYSFYYNLRDFANLNYDYVILYSDYNDLGYGNRFLYRHSNPFFRAFGYMPILQLLAFEKMLQLKSGGNLDGAYRGKQITFSPNLKGRLEISSLERALSVYNNLENYVSRIKKEKDFDFDYRQFIKDRWSWHKYFMKKAIDFCLENHKKVIIVTAPYINTIHKNQQSALRGMLLKYYKNNSDILYINLGDSLSLKDEKLSFDGMHLTDYGCDIIAQKLSQKIMKYVCGNSGFAPFNLELKKYR